MEALLTIKAYIKKFVGKNEVFITPILKFLLSFLALSQVSNKLGYFTKLASGPIVLIVALAGSFLPNNLTIVIIAAITLAHLYKLSLEVTVVVFALFLVLFLLYFRFASQDSYAVLLTPVSFAFNIPYVLPISMGLVGNASSMVSVASGVIVYQVLHFVSANADSLKAGDSLFSLDVFKASIDAIISNRNMIVLAVAFAATVLVVYLIRRLSINYSWFLAIGCGVLTMIIMVAACNKVFSGDVSVGKVFGGLIVSVIINIILQFFCFDLDYNRTEKVQFEDDEYYYYVKAVPKNDIKLSGKRKAQPAPERVRRESVIAPEKIQRSVPVRTAEKTVSQQPVKQQPEARAYDRNMSYMARTSDAPARKAVKSPITDDEEIFLVSDETQPIPTDKVNRSMGRKNM